MDAKNYCRSIETELYAWKAKMYDMIRKVDRLRSTEKEEVAMIVMFDSPLSLYNRF